MNGLQKPTPEWNTVAHAIFNGSFEFFCGLCDPLPVGENNRIPGWQLHGGGISSDTQVSVENAALALKGQGARATHNRFYIPANATHLMFDTRVVNPSVILTVSIDSTSVGSLMLTSATADFSQNTLAIPSALRDGVHTLSFEIIQAWSQTTQPEEVRIDNVRLDSLADTTPPTVSITGLATGMTYTSAGIVALAATASDNVAVTKVEFYDGTVNKATVTAPPYRYNWPMSAADNGAHTWTARAYDAAGNIATSSVVTVTVSIDILSPAVSISSPVDGANVTTSTITVSGTASDPGSPSSGLNSVQYALMAAIG